MGEGVRKTLASYSITQCSGTTYCTELHSIKDLERIVGILHLGYTGLTVLKIYESVDYFEQGFNASIFCLRALLSVHGSN